MCEKRFPFPGCCTGYIRSSAFTAEHAEIAENAMEEKAKIDQITRRIIGAAIEVHKTIGPGLLESAYTGHVWLSN
jgi:hypothetical protein